MLRGTVCSQRNINNNELISGKGDENENETVRIEILKTQFKIIELLQVSFLGVRI